MTLTTLQLPLDSRPDKIGSALILSQNRFDAIERPSLETRLHIFRPQPRIFSYDKMLLRSRGE